MNLFPHFFPLPYKLVNLFIFEKVSCKMSKNLSYPKVIGQGLKWTYEFKVLFLLLIFCIILELCTWASMDIHIFAYFYKTLK